MELKVRPIDADAAIEYIKAKMIPNPREGSRGIVYNAGYELAIRAIEVQPTIDNIKFFHNIGNGEEWVDGVYDAINAMEDVNAVDAAPVVHGRWVKMTGMMPPEYHGHYECSECQWHMKGLRNSWTREEELLYCPNCGAKMMNSPMWDVDGERRDDDAAD